MMIIGDLKVEISLKSPKLMVEGMGNIIKQLAIFEIPVLRKAKFDVSDSISIRSHVEDRRSTFN